jgi:hypothetical protein
MRRDTSIDGRDPIVIIYVSTKTSYVLMPARRSYAEILSDHGDQAARMAVGLFDPSSPCGREDVACSSAGTEMIDGRLCDKWTYSTAIGRATIWVDRKLNSDIKRSGPGNFDYQLKNIVEREPEHSLFEIPTGYTKMPPFAGEMLGKSGAK